MPGSVLSGPTDPTATLVNATAVNATPDDGSSEARSAWDSAKPLPRALRDEKQPDPSPAFHPFLPNPLISVPFFASVPPSPTVGDSLLQGQNANSTHAL